ncbi:MAG: hypothetical protein J7L17_00695 [Thaumarchaeota archaeon]|nr:hypothetical protein [Nitrososphaerota archaeon]
MRPVIIVPARTVDRKTLKKALKLRKLGRVVVACSLPISLSSSEVTILPCSKGKWSSILETVKRAPSDRYLLIDSDMPISLEEAERLLDELNSSDLVITRRTPDLRASPDRALTALFGLFAKLLGVSFRDPQAGAKAFKRRLVIGIADLLPTGYLGDLALIRYAVSRGYMVRELGVAWRDSRSWSGRVRIMVTIFLEICRDLPKIILAGRRFH